MSAKRGSKKSPKKPKKPKKRKLRKSGPKKGKRKKVVTPSERRKLFERNIERDKKLEEIPWEINLGASSQEDAYRTISNRLQEAYDRLPAGFDGRVLTHPYADGSVDGELSVKVDVDTRETEYDLYESFGRATVGSRYWVSMGLRYEVRADDERYRRWRGLTQVETNYQRATQTNIVEVHVVLRNKLIAGMDRAFGMEAHSIFVRLHWNPEDRKPYR